MEPKAFRDLARQIISFREHYCASWPTCLARYRVPGLTFTQRPQSYTGTYMWPLPLSSQNPLQLLLRVTPCVQGKEGPS